MMNPVFRDPVVALHLAYAIQARPVLAPCAMRRVLITIMESMDMINARQCDWLARLIGSPSDAADFSGLTPQEIHAQCVFVTEAVLHRLTPCETFVLLARFAQMAREKQAGVFGLAEYLLATSPIDNRDALTDLVWRRYLPRRYRGGYSFRDIERRTKVHRSTLSRGAEWLDDQCDGLELVALRHLEETFVPDGVCGALAMQS